MQSTTSWPLSDWGFKAKDHSQIHPESLGATIQPVLSFIAESSVSRLEALDVASYHIAPLPEVIQLIQSLQVQLVTSSGPQFTARLQKVSQPLFISSVLKVAFQDSSYILAPKELQMVVNTPPLAPHPTFPRRTKPYSSFCLSVKACAQP